LRSSSATGRTVKSLLLDLSRRHPKVELEVLSRWHQPFVYKFLVIMFTSLAISSALVSSSLAALLPATPVADAVITPGPNIELLRKQNDIRYMGYISYTEGWTSEICDVGR
jgi:hypothetical protein